MAWTAGAILQCRSRNDELNWLAMGALTVHHALSFQVGCSSCCWTVLVTVPIAPCHLGYAAADCQRSLSPRKASHQQRHGQACPASETLHVTSMSRPQIRFDRHMLLCALAEAPAALLPLLSAPHAGASGFRLLPPLLRWAVAVVAAPAAAVWLSERRSRSEFAAAHHMGENGLPAPKPSPDAFFRPPILSAPDSAAVLAKLASAQASPYVRPPLLRL